MIAALATLVFLSTLWMLVVLSAAVLGSSGEKILVALKGKSAAPAIAIRPVRVRHQRFQPLRPARISARQRAAA
jgi:hypothetical protein